MAQVVKLLIDFVFWQGTTADQDTRFSNKHAKLLKSQKFPPELENLVRLSIHHPCFYYLVPVRKGALCNRGIIIVSYLECTRESIYCILTSEVKQKVQISKF